MQIFNGFTLLLTGALLFRSDHQFYKKAQLASYIVVEVMMKPNFESPAHRARDLVERNITVYLWPDAQIWRQWLSQSDIPEYRKIAETMIITKSWYQYYDMTENGLLSQGTHARICSYMEPDELDWGTEYDHDLGMYKYNSGRGYYRGEMLSGKVPVAGYLTHKKWHLNEVTIEHCNTEQRALLNLLN